ncbi:MULTISPECIES: NAD(P)H-dependent oxidoreductase [unclassified Devosia]|jgi:NAD(P)H-dependent FMN reductase|uniref:NADPH-dependent FMN reductase n=1 Tax=unclassified Devosia TaxID=196773 RepID=UPI00086D5E20|nr:MULTISPECIES: NAD(P)H-dependent oxidoreductase [unclassified Devosia]MBN9363623.1 NAD(P)H-dependent oxidoreductase [Devosia sp.]ODS82802.1 MAG: FMN reductase [Devosia sp. SCN 66-27]OJX26929.1 MAG: FMN reductase [Devosia sp. 66-14]
MSSKPRIGIILSTTRETRFADRPAQWVLDIAKARGDADYEIVDLRDFPIPFFDAVGSPRFVPQTNEVALRWAKKVSELDGYIFVTAEYNRSISGVLKNALDHIYDEPARKPAAFVGYGAVGAARAVEQLRLMAVELSMVPMKAGVHINMEPLLGMLRGGKDFADYDYLAPTVTAMLDELAWYTRTLKLGRQAEALERAA